MGQGTGAIMSILTGISSGFLRGVYGRRPQKETGRPSIVNKSFFFSGRIWRSLLTKIAVFLGGRQVVNLVRPRPYQVLSGFRLSRGPGPGPETPTQGNTRNRAVWARRNDRGRFVDRGGAHVILTGCRERPRPAWVVQYVRQGNVGPRAAREARRRLRMPSGGKYCLVCTVYMPAWAWTSSVAPPTEITGRCPMCASQLTTSNCFSGLIRLSTRSSRR
ncbi:hypothetical protein DFH07DRAFT_137959 [Mycena maculata]|uniref:Uncharacterized protein n=1 Tax=Mycena maculata TaxID=230809 RepID=A0AAD7I215_9AGAR|nr:hypothetical protein DFH07DRAFT_137959 [Mycena maculata]